MRDHTTYGQLFYHSCMSQPELIGSLKVGNACFFVQLILRPMRTKNQLYKNPNIVTSYQLSGYNTTWTNSKSELTHRRHVSHLRVDVDLLEPGPHHGVLLHGLPQRLLQAGDQRDVAARPGPAAPAQSQGRPLARVDLVKMDT